MTDWLHRNRFSYKKPLLVPGKANLEAQEAWISSYKQLRQNLGEDETICFDQIFSYQSLAKAIIAQVAEERRLAATKESQLQRK